MVKFHIKRLVIATSNPGKGKEFRRLLEPLGIEIIVPERSVNVKETGTTFLENAYLKAKAYYREFKIPSLADDSGLVVEALNGMPGIYSSRFYSMEFGGVEEIREGESRDEANVRKLLRLMEGKTNRRAKFVAYLVLYMGNGGIFTVGECEGEITHEPRGNRGFGYDPVFKPAGFDRTMAQLEPHEKDKISHRGRALRKLLEFLGVQKQGF